MTKTNRKPPRDDEEQSATFIKTAREIEADGDQSKADALMGRLAKMKPEPRSKKVLPKPRRKGS